MMKEKKTIKKKSEKNDKEKITINNNNYKNMINDEREKNDKEKIRKKR